MARVVVLSHALPFNDIPHAGGRYMLKLVDALAELGHDFCVVVPDNPANRAASAASGAPEHLIVGLPRAATFAGRVRNYALTKVDAFGRRLDAGLHSLPFAHQLTRNRQVLDLLRSADVVDLQWLDMIRLAGRVRRINPDARIIGTYHDVQSQLFAREASRNTGRARRFWDANVRLARFWEQRGLRQLDVAMTFSNKDEALLGGSARRPIRVVPPPLAGRTLPPERRLPGGRPLVVFVSYLARDENNDAATWLLRDIWPRVLAEVPDAQLALVGAGASEPLLALAATEPSVTLTGFVPDVAPWLARAWASIVPLRFGAGVKFKTVEAILAGVPTVATPVGAEGIDASGLTGHSAHPAELAARLAWCLRMPEAAHAAARAAQLAAFDTYSWPRFLDNIQSGTRGEV